MIKPVFSRIIFKIAVAFMGSMVVALPVSVFEGGHRHHRCEPQRTRNRSTKPG